MLITEFFQYRSLNSIEYVADVYRGEYRDLFKPYKMGIVPVIVLDCFIM